MNKLATILSAIVTMLALSTLVQAENAGVVTYTVNGTYADVKQDVQDGVLNAGLKIDYRGDISTMLERTGKDVGSTKTVYKHAEFFQFCSARLSRNAMEADASNMSICPYVIYMFEPVATPGTITVGYKRPTGGPGEASQKAIGAIDKLLDGIVKEAAGQ